MFWKATPGGYANKCDERKFKFNRTFAGYTVSWRCTRKDCFKITKPRKHPLCCTSNDKPDNYVYSIPFYICFSFGDESLPQWLIGLFKDCNVDIPARRCAECGVMVKIFQGKRRIFIRPYNHVCTHLGKLMFECRYCDKKFKCLSTVRVHLWKFHKLPGVGNNFVDLSEHHRQDIMNMLGRCFGRHKSEQPTTAAQPQMSQ